MLLLVRFFFFIQPPRGKQEVKLRLLRNDGGLREENSRITFQPPGEFLGIFSSLNTDFVSVGVQSSESRCREEKSVLCPPLAGPGLACSALGRSFEFGRWDRTVVTVEDCKDTTLRVLPCDQCQFCERQQKCVCSNYLSFVLDNIFLN